MGMDSSMTNCLRMYEKFCDDVSLNADAAYDTNIKILLLIFQKNIDTKHTFNSIFENNIFVDWDHIDLVKSTKIFKDPISWISTFNFIRLNTDDITWKLFVQKHKIFSHFIHSMSSAKLELKNEQLVHLFLLLNISNLSAINVIELYCSTTLNKSVHKEILQFFSVWADIPFDKHDRTTVCIVLLKDLLTVDETRYGAERELMKTRESKLEQIFKQKHIQASTMRPRLRSKLKKDILQHSAMATLDTFRSWCDTIRFPTVFSMCYKKKIYFTMSQKKIQRDKFIHEYVLEHDLAILILQYQVTLPDIDVLTETIQQCRLIAEPFQELHEFREQCFSSFSIQQKSKLRLNDLLQLYIAAYQADAVWKSVWKNIFPVLSIQIIKDVEQFVADHEVNHIAVMRIVFYNVKKT